MSFFIPVVGMFCMLLVALFLIFKPLPAGDLLKEFEKYTTESDTDVVKERAFSNGATFIQSAHKVEPFADMLSTPVSHLKQTVLEAISRRKNPKLFPLVLKALEDPRTEIHQFAIAKIQKLRHEYELKIMKAAEALKVVPTSLEAHYRLALAYCQYMKSGLMDKSVEEFFQDEFHKEYRKILSLPHSPTEEHIYSDLGQLSLQIRRWDEAEAAFGKALELNPNSIEATVGLMKMYYEQKKYDKTFEQIQRIREVNAPDKNITPPLRELNRCWLSDAPAVHEDRP